MNISTNNLKGKHKKTEFDTGIVKMAVDIALTLFRIMLQQGVEFSESSMKTLRSTFFQESRKAISKFDALAKINGLDYDRKKEIQVIEGFEQALQKACEEFMDDPLGTPSLSAWISVRSVLPEISDEFLDVVASQR